MRSSRPQSSVSAWLLVCAGALVGLASGACEVSVELGFPPDGGCDGGGDVVFENNETVPDPDGCNTCTCKDGELVCTKLACDPCPEADRPTCSDVPVDMLGCYLEAVCSPDGWQCIDNCPCATLAAPECPLPFPSCYYEGPFCDGQEWSCGTPVCPSCSEPFACDPPADPLCYTEASCTEELGWVCQEFCPPCEEPPPVCDGFSVASCSDQGWVCKGNQTCGTELIDCPPSPYPYCTVYMECSQGGWLCQETCELDYCPDMPPACEPSGPPNCSPYLTCTSQGWVCAETCI